LSSEKDFPQGNVKVMMIKKRGSGKARERKGFEEGKTSKDTKR
jgi:hypothetical protein